MNILDILLMILSGLPVFLATIKNQKANKVAPVFGLFITQPFWVWYSIITNSLGLLPTTAVFATIYANGIYQQWRK